MPISVNYDTQGEFKYETPFLQNPQGRLSIGLAAGALNTSVAQIVDTDGVLLPGTVFVRTNDGTYQPLHTSTQTYAINGVTTGSDQFNVSGDQTDWVEVGDLIQITGSTGNDGVYRVADVSHDGTNTVIVVEGAIDDGTADGDLKVSEPFTMVGVVPYSLNLFADNDASTLSGHGQMSVVVATRGELVHDILTDQLGRTLTFEEEAAIENQSSELSIVYPT